MIQISAKSWKIEGFVWHLGLWSTVSLPGLISQGKYFLSGFAGLWPWSLMSHHSSLSTRLSPHSRRGGDSRRGILQPIRAHPMTQERLSDHEVWVLLILFLSTDLEDNYLVNFVLHTSPPTTPQHLYFIEQVDKTLLALHKPIGPFAFAFSISILR